MFMLNRKPENYPEGTKVYLLVQDVLDNSKISIYIARVKRARDRLKNDVPVMISEVLAGSMNIPFYQNYDYHQVALSFDEIMEEIEAHEIDKTNIVKHIFIKD